VVPKTKTVHDISINFSMNIAYITLKLYKSINDIILKMSGMGKVSRNLLEIVKSLIEDGMC
jgi:hypothetical protein